MNNNDVLRQFRYALDVPDKTMVNIFELAECRMNEEQLAPLLKKEGEEGYVACTDPLLELFLDGVILYNRGKQNTPPGQQEHKKSHAPGGLSNNTILKKLRIALELKQEDMVELFKLGGMNVSKGELTALFRKEGHKNYKPCGDQYLKRFLKGLGVRHRM